MPIYEYRCETDGTVIELMRPMAQADAPVPDPENQGRTFKRVQSTFATSGGPAPAHVHKGGCCPCGKTASQGGCGV